MQRITVSAHHGSAFFLADVFLLRTSDFKSLTCAAVQALARKRVTCALGLNGQSLCFIARPSGLT